MSDQEEQEEPNRSTGKSINVRTVKWRKGLSFVEWRDEFLDALSMQGLEDLLEDENADANSKRCATFRFMLNSALAERKEARKVARTAGRVPSIIWKRLKDEYGNLERDILLLRELKGKINRCSVLDHKDNFSKCRLFLESIFQQLEELGTDYTDKERKEALVSALSFSAKFEQQLDVLAFKIEEDDFTYAGLVKYLRARESVQKSRGSARLTGGTKSTSHNVTTKQHPCKFHAKGNCKKGKKCNWLHPSLQKLSAACHAFGRGH